MSPRIVIGVDTSAPSRAALAWGITRAFDTGMPIHILHAVDGPDDSPAVQQAAAFLSMELAFALSQGVSASSELVRDGPFDALVSASRGADLVIIGTHKTGFIQGHSIGSRFVDLTSAAYCPVAFIPSIPLTSRRGVVVAVDDSGSGSDTGREAVRFAAVEAQRLGQDLTFLYPDPWHGSTDERSTQRDFSDDPAARAQAQANEWADRGATALLTKTRIIRRGAALDLIDATLTAALVVIPHPGAHGVMGSAASALVHDVLLNLGGPTIVVPRAV